MVELLQEAAAQISQAKHCVLPISMIPSNHKNEKDLFDLFCDLFMGPAQWEIFKQVLLAAVFYIIFRFFWYEVSSYVADQNDYRISSEQIVLTSRPLWVPPTLEKSALANDASFTSRPSLSLLDRQFVQNLTSAFRAEPWVREVNSVRLQYPASVEVNAEFREPVAFIAMNSSIENGLPSRAVYQIDSDGVLLPTDYITVSISSNPESIYDYPLIEGICSTPLSTYGQPWGDPVVDEAALFADFLRGDFKQLGIAKIMVSEKDEDKELPPEKRSQQRIWHLATTEGKEIIWGSFPMSSVIRSRSGSRSLYEVAKDEAFRAEEPKLARLRNLAQGKHLDLLSDDFFPIDLTLDDSSK